MSTKTGIFTNALSCRNSIANYPDASEIDALFNGYDHETLQKRMNDDMLNVIRLSNVLRSGDIIDFDISQGALENRAAVVDAPTLDDEDGIRRYQVVDLNFNALVFKRPYSEKDQLENIDATIPMKDYANINLTYRKKKQKSFGVESHVRSRMDVVIEDIENGSRFVVPLGKDTKFSLVRRVAIGDRFTGSDARVKNIIPNFVVINTPDAWRSVAMRPGAFRDAVNNTYRINYEMDDGSVIELHKQSDSGPKEHVDCMCVKHQNNADINTKICHCTSNNEIVKSEHLAHMFKHINPIL